MAYDIVVEKRIEEIVGSWKQMERKPMFGGVCHLVNGAMFSGVYKEFLILRLGERGAAEALKSPHVKSFDITGRPMKGWVMVGAGGFRTREELEAWLVEARDFAAGLPGRSSTRSRP